MDLLTVKHEIGCGYGTACGPDDYVTDCDCEYLRTHKTIEECEDEWVAYKLLKKYGSGWMYRIIELRDQEVMNQDVAEGKYT